MFGSHSLADGLIVYRKESGLLSFPFDWVGVLWPQLSSVKTCALGPPRPLSPSVPAVACRQLVLVRAAA